MIPEQKKDRTAELLKETPPTKTCGEFPPQYFGIHETSLPPAKLPNSSSTTESSFVEQPARVGLNLCHSKFLDD